MATGTGPFDTQDIANKVWNPPGTAPSPTGDSISVYLLPVQAMLGSGTAQGLGPNPLFVVQPAFRQFVLDSVTNGSTSATGTTTTGLGGYRTASVYINFGTITGTISTMDLFIDSRLDGTNYTNLFHTTYTSATGSALLEVVFLRRDTFATGGLVLTTPYVSVAGDIGVGTVRQIGWGDDLRVRRSVTGGTTAPIFTYTITVNLSS